MAISQFPERKPSKFHLRLILIIFSLLILASTVGLDYIKWRKGEKSYLFSLLASKKKGPAKQEFLSRIIKENLSSRGIPSDSIREYMDKGNVLHLNIKFSMKEYNELEVPLIKELEAQKASILQKEERKEKEKNFFLWLVEGGKKEKLIILFSCQKEIPVEQVSRKKVAIIVDDMGYNLEVLKDLCSLNRPLTISILPFSPLAKETAELAHENGLEVMLHLPLESLNNQEAEKETKGIIHSRMTEEEIKLTLENCLGQVPHLKGVNNHMGSKITRNEPLMRIILQVLKEKNLYFIDSRTSSKSVAYNLAQEMGIPSSYRRVFLDATSSEVSIKRRLVELFGWAKKKGEAIGICHPLEETLRVLKANSHLVEEYELEPVFVSQIVRPLPEPPKPARERQ